jgi:pyruvate dehydrogenase E1 component subunit alpha
MSTEKLLTYYREMLLIRRFEEKCGQLYGMGLISGFCHLYIGQEAVIVGLHHAKEKDDATITSYRDHAHILAAGMDPKYIMAELLGRETGCSKGKGGSMHMFDLKNNFYGGHGIVGAQVPLGTGLAFARKYRKENSAVFAFYGDGAAHQGQIYESYNMASKWKLPIIYVIENNHYGMGTHVDRVSSTTTLYKRGEGFGIPGKQVDGMNVLKVMEEGKKALAHVKSGKGPMILEMMTYRYRGHSMSDPATYRTKEEVNGIKDKSDPIITLKAHLLKKCGVKEDELKALDKELRDNVNEATEFAKNSAEPGASELFTQIHIEEE